MFLRAAVAHVGTLDPAPDLVLMTGDLVNDGRAAQYAHLRALLDPLGAPLVMIAGNHDDRAALQEAFPDQSLRGVHHVGPIRLIVLDSLVPGQPGGRLGREQLAWLDAALDEDRMGPVIVAVHHPPFVTGIDHMDAMGLQDSEAFGGVIARHPNVERVLCGHLHRPIQTRWRGTLAMTAPSVAHQVTLDLRPGAAGSYYFEPPALLLHCWQPGLGMVSHHSYIDRSDGPYSFDDQPDGQPDGQPV
jgi:3',5'-cyclic AMP phosphodiesterase CpdA